MTNPRRSLDPIRSVPAAIVLLATLAAGASQAQERPLAFSGAAIETVGKTGRIEPGVIVLRNGSIEAVGPPEEVDIPGDARLIDATGQTIMPGIIEPAYPYRGPRDDSGGGRRMIVIGGRVIVLGSSSPSRSPTFTRASDLFYPYDPGLAPLLRSGLTYLNLVPSDYGRAAVARLTPEQPERMLIKPDGRLFVSVTNATASLDVIRSGLEQATKEERPDRDGSDSNSDSESDSNEGGRSDPADDDEPSTPSRSARNLWRAVAEGKAPLIAEASNASAILYLLELLEDHDDVSLILSASGEDIYRTLDPLKNKPGKAVSLLLRPTIDFIPNTRNRINIPRLVHDTGLSFVFSQGSTSFMLRESQDTPLFAVGYLVETGLPRAVALDALTLGPARMLGLDDRLGSLDNKKTASLLIFEGDPLDPYSQLRRVIIEGRTVYDSAN